MEKRKSSILSKENLKKKNEGEYKSCACGFSTLLKRPVIKILFADSL